MKRKYEMNNINPSNARMNYMERAKKIDMLVEDYRSQKAQEAIEAKEREIKERRNALMENASRGISDITYKNKVRQKNLVESITYLEKTSKVALIEAISLLAEKSLLLDEYTYSRLNPTFSEDIHATVENILENVESFDITNESFSVIMDKIAKLIPAQTINEDGKISNIPLDYAISLTEARVKEMESSEDAELNDQIDKLTGNIKKKVAKIVNDDRKKLQKVEEEYTDTTGEPNPNEPVPAEGEMPPEGQEGGEEMPPEEGAPAEGEMPPEEQAGGEEMPPEEGAPAEEEMGGEEMPPEEGAPGTDPNAFGAPKKQVQMLPDGTMNINVFEHSPAFVREAKPCGILETLAVNEAKDLISEGKEYSSDLAIANALTYLTILETLNVTGIVPLTDVDYKKIIHASHGKTVEDIKSETETKKKALVKMSDKKSPCEVKVPVMQNIPVPAPNVPESDPLLDGKGDCCDCKKYLSEDALRDLLEDMGYSLNVDDFEDAVKNEGYIQVEKDKYIKKF